MRLAEFLASGVPAADAALLARFIPDAERTAGEWRSLLAALRASHLQLGAHPASSSPPDLLAGGLARALLGEVERRLAEQRPVGTEWTLTPEGYVALTNEEGAAVQVVPREKFAGHTHAWNDVIGRPLNYPPTSHAHVIGEVGGLSAALGLKADLAGGAVPLSQLPQSVKRQRFTAISQSGMLGLPAYMGDVCERLDLGGALYQLAAPGAATAANWVMIQAAGGAVVTSINSKTGAVVLTHADVGAAPASHLSDRANPHAVTKEQVGLGNLTNDAQVKRAELGRPSGVATLGADGRVPAAQLPEAQALARERREVSSSVGGLAPGQVRDELLALSSSRLIGLCVQAQGLRQASADRLRAQFYEAGEAGAWSSLAYDAEFGLYGGHYLVRDDARGWAYRDLAGGGALRVRLKNTGDQPIPAASVTITYEEF